MTGSHADRDLSINFPHEISTHTLGKPFFEILLSKTTKIFSSSIGREPGMINLLTTHPPQNICEATNIRDGSINREESYMEVDSLVA